MVVSNSAIAAATTLQHVTTQPRRKVVRQQGQAVHTRDMVVEPLSLKATQEHIATMEFRAYMKQGLLAIFLEASTYHLALHSLILVIIVTRAKNR
jgi:hypothetical protein